MTDEKSKKEYYVQQVADEVGVHKMTIRNYVKRGLLPNRRKPANNYSIFYREDINSLKRYLKTITLKGADRKNGKLKRKPKTKA